MSLANYFLKQVKNSSLNVNEESNFSSNEVDLSEIMSDVMGRVQQIQDKFELEERMKQFRDVRLKEDKRQTEIQRVNFLKEHKRGKKSPEFKAKEIENKVQSYLDYAKKVSDYETHLFIKPEDEDKLVISRNDALLEHTSTIKENKSIDTQQSIQEEKIVEKEVSTADNAFTGNELGLNKPLVEESPVKDKELKKDTRFSKDAQMSFDF